MNNQTIYDYIQAEENRFNTEDSQVGENWYFNFRKHVQLIFHLMHGVFYTGENDWMRSFKQVMRPLINLSTWTEDIEVKDVAFFIEESADHVLSFLLKKYHDEVYTREHDLDTFFDKLAESDIAYGAALVQKGVEIPEVIPLQSVAFCDQTDMAGGPIAFKHYFSPDKLRSMSKYGWGNENNGADISLDDLCELANEDKDVAGTQGGQKNTTTGKTIEVYIVRGSMPDDYLNDSGDFDYYCNQLQIRAFYTNKENKKVGVCLYRKKENEGNLQVLVSQEVYNRALGYGDGEALLPQQIFTNLLNIHKTNMLVAGSKSPLITDDPNFTQKSKIQDMENLEVVTIEEGKTLKLVPTMATADVQLFENSIKELYESGQINVSAFDSLQGKEESSGMTFRGQERLVAQGQGFHERRRGQRAKFIESVVYRFWVIPDMVKDITKGKKFLASLSSEEMSWVADQLATNHVNRRLTDMILAGKMPTKEEQDQFTQIFKQDFFKKGNKHLLEILKEDFKGIEDKIGINIAAKQKNLTGMSDKVFSIIESAMANPQGYQNIRQDPVLNAAFETVLEYSNIPIPDFHMVVQGQPVMSPVQQNDLGKPALAPQNNGTTA